MDKGRILSVVSGSRWESGGKEYVDSYVLEVFSVVPTAQEMEQINE